MGEAVRENASVLQLHGGSPIGNSRVKLTNVEDCVKRGLVVEGENPLHRAAEQLMMDQVTILHTIGGDDTNTQAAKIAEYLEGHNYPVTVVGMPKTIDNDVVPIKQSLGAWTAEAYMDSLHGLPLLPGLNLTKQRKCLHAVYVPEVRIDVDAEARRLKRVMDTHDCVNIFLSEGAGVHDIVAQLEARGESVPRDAFGHVKLDKVQPGAYFAKQFAEKLGA